MCFTVVELIVFIVTHNISATMLGSYVVELCCFFCPFLMYSTSLLDGKSGFKFVLVSFFAKSVFNLCASVGTCIITVQLCNKPQGPKIFLIL